MAIHEMTLMLPKFEHYEEASQIRRSSKGVRSTIVEGYGRRHYQADYLRFLIYALASNLETIDHLDILYETKSLKDIATYESLGEKLQILGKMLTNLIRTIQKSVRST